MTSLDQLQADHVLPMIVRRRQQPKPLDIGGKPTLAWIMWAVSEASGIAINDLISHRRQVPVSAARHVYFWMCRHLTSKSYPEIGKFCGNRNHTTVMHGVARIDQDMAKFVKLIEMASALMASSGVDTGG